VFRDTRGVTDRQRHDEVAQRVRERLGARIALLSTFAGGRHFFIGAAGLPADLEQAREIPMIESFCTYVLEHGVQLIVDDVRWETRVAAHPLIAELGILAYAGWQILDEEGHTVGVLSVMDDKPRPWSPQELLVLLEEAHDCAPAVRADVAGEQP
jgi:hypothetical protein